MFVGEHSGKLDAKGRVIFPASLKRQIPEDAQKQSMVLKKAIYHKCLILYTFQEWQYQTNFIKKRLNPFNKRHAEFLREYYRGTAEIYLDSNSRMLIPKKLLEYIEADKDIVFAGQTDQIQIWSNANYYREQMSEQDFADLSSDIFGGDFGFYNED